MQSKSVSLWRIAAHDFNRSLRVWLRFMTAPEILKLLVQERSRSSAMMVRNLFFALAFGFWLQTDKAALDLKISLFELSIPTAFVNFALSATIFATTINFINYMVLNEFVRVVSNKAFKFDVPWALTAILEGSSAWSIGATQQFRFFRSSNSHVVFGNGSVFLLLLPYACALVALVWINFVVGLRVLAAGGFFSFAGLFTLIGWMIASYPIALIIISAFPFKFEKNKAFIRWLFLLRMHRRAGSWPTMIDRWVADANAERRA